jgi:site-specific DNA recombinase
MLTPSNKDILQRARSGNLSGLNLAGLVRKSTPEHADLAKEENTRPYLTGFDLKSRDQQEEDARSYVTGRNGNYVYTYDEPDTSAWKRRRVTLPDRQVIYRVKRPVYEAALKDLTQGVAPNGQRLDGLVVYDIDRLTRDNHDLEDAIDVVVYHQRLIIDITGTIDLLTENGRDMARVLVTMAGKQSAATSRRLTRKHQAVALAGIPTGRHRPFGWQADKRTLHPLEAPLLAEAHKDVCRNISLHTICREWKEAGITTTCGKFWTTTALRYRLLSP